MTQTPTAPAANYNDLKTGRDTLFKKLDETKTGLEKALAEAYADHIVAHKDNHGEGLGEAIYKGVSAYVGKEFFPGFMGIASPTDAEKEVITSTLTQTIGYSAESLDKKFGKEKVVAPTDLGEELEKVTQGVSQLLNKTHFSIIGKLKDADLPRLQAFIREMSTEAGINVKDEYIGTLKGAQKQYGIVANLYFNKKKANLQEMYDKLSTAEA